jgi:cellulose synthase/poly-beta-1,6-N-acetylglucosamine synthase-like glycosyltransferase
MTTSTELPYLITEKSTPEPTVWPTNGLPGLLEPRVSVVIPALNEAKNLPYVLPRIPTWVHEVLLVDGHSTDDTVEVARRLRPDICIVPQVRAGKGAALQTGFTVASGDIIVMPMVRQIRQKSQSSSPPCWPEPTMPKVRAF